MHRHCTLLEKEVGENYHMSNLKDKAKDKVDAAAEALKKTSDNVIDKSKDLAHDAGKAVEQGGKRMQKV